MKQGKGITQTKDQKIIANYKDDIKHGDYEVISNNNSYYEKGRYQNGVRHGKVYIKKGEDETVLNFNNGE